MSKDVLFLEVKDVLVYKIKMVSFLTFYIKLIFVKLELLYVHSLKTV